MAGRIELAVFGHTTRDFIVTYDGRLQLGYLGGGGKNAAAGASYWAKDGEVGLVTRRASAMPPVLLEPLARHPGLDIEGVRVMEGEGIKLWLLYDLDGYRHWVKHHDSANRMEAAPAPGDIPPRYLDAGGFHIAPLPPGEVLALLNALPEGRVVQLDPHYEWFFQRHIGLWEQILKKVTVVTPSEDEFTKFWEIPYGQPVENYMPYLRRLAAMGPEVVVLKMGGKGAVLHVREEDAFYLVPPCARDDEIIDVTGAGDSFCGSFCINLLRGRPLLEAAVCGMVGSAVSMGLRGVPEYLGVPFGRAEALYQRVRKQMANRIVRLDNG